MSRSSGRRSEPVGKRFARMLRSIGLLLGSGGIVALGWEAINWFRDGIWINSTLLELWLSLGNSYSLRAASGTDRFLLQLLDLPVAATLLVLALALLIAARRIGGTK